MPEGPSGGTASRLIAVVEPARDALRLVQGLLRSRGHRVIGMEDSADLLDMLAACNVDCVILSLEENDLGTIKALTDRQPGIPVIAASTDTCVDNVVRIIKAGAAYVVAKPYDIEQLAAHIEMVAADSQHVPPSHADTPQGFRLLTGRENEVLAEIAGGASSKEVGRRLGISPRTVDVHRARIKEKLQVRRAVDLVRLVYDAKKQERKN